nr:hypothetical protein [Mycoplasmopsis bovis]
MMIYFLLEILILKNETIMKPLADWARIVLIKMFLSQTMKIRHHLVHTINKYANSYDKIIHRSKLKYINPKIFKLYDFVNNGFLYKNINSLNDWMQYVKSSSSKKI